MSLKEYPQYHAENRHFFPLKNSASLAKQLLRGQMGQHNYQLHEHYQGLLLKVLPPSWQHKVYFERIEKGEWHLLVANNEDAFKLRFLQSEITQALNQHLNQAARLRIHIQPSLWQLIPQTRRPIHVKNARSYTEEQAKLSIKQRLDSLQQKINGSKSR